MEKNAQKMRSRSEGEEEEPLECGKISTFVKGEKWTKQELYTKLSTLSTFETVYNVEGWKKMKEQAFCGL